MNAYTRRSLIGAIGGMIAASGIGAARPGKGNGEAKGRPGDPGNSQRRGNGNGNGNRPSLITFTDQETDGESVVVKNAFLPSSGYLSIHDARTRLFGDEDENVRVVKSLIGITERLEAGKHKNVEVDLFNDAAPAVDQFGRTGPLSESQPLIAIPHEDRVAGESFVLETDPEEFLVGDGAFLDGVNKLGELGATNDIGTAFVEGDDEEEREAAREETNEIREKFG